MCNVCNRITFTAKKNFSCSDSKFCTLNKYNVCADFLTDGFFDIVGIVSSKFFGTCTDTCAVDTCFKNPGFACAVFGNETKSLDFAVDSLRITFIFNVISNINRTVVEVTCFHIHYFALHSINSFCEKVFHKLLILLNFLIVKKTACCSVTGIHNECLCKRNVHTECVDTGMLMKNGNVNSYNTVFFSKLSHS